MSAAGHTWQEQPGRLSWDEISEIAWPSRAGAIVRNLAPSQWLVRGVMLLGVLVAVAGTLLQPGLVGRPMLVGAVVFGLIACLNPQVIVAPLVYVCVLIPWMVEPSIGPALLLAVVGFAVYQVSLALAATAPPNVAIPFRVARPYVIAGVVLAGAGCLVWLGVNVLTAAALPGMLVVAVGAVLLIAALGVAMVRLTRR